MFMMPTLLWLAPVLAWHAMWRNPSYLPLSAKKRSAISEGCIEVRTPCGQLEGMILLRLAAGYQRDKRAEMFPDIALYRPSRIDALDQFSAEPVLWGQLK